VVGLQVGLHKPFGALHVPIVLAAAMYFVLLWPGVRLLSRLEHRMIASR